MKRCRHSRHWIRATDVMSSLLPNLQSVYAKWEADSPFAGQRSRKDKTLDRDARYKSAVDNGKNAWMQRFPNNSRLPGEAPMVRRQARNKKSSKANNHINAVNLLLVVS